MNSPLKAPHSRHMLKASIELRRGSITSMAEKASQLSVVAGACNHLDLQLKELLSAVFT
jgi:hypothetical protein